MKFPRFQSSQFQVFAFLPLFTKENKTKIFGGYLNDKKNNLAFLTLIIVGLFSLFLINISAQNKVIAETQTPSATDKVLQTYISISSLPMNERPATFSKLSAEDKANIFKFHLAFQFIKRPNLSNEQKDLILESISMAIPESYDDKKPQKLAEAQQEANILEMKVNALFSKQEGFEIFARLGGTKEDVAIVQKYQEIFSFVYREDRIDSFNKLANQDKSNLMRTHLASQIAYRVLSDSQIRFIADVIFLLSPEIYGIDKKSNEWEQKEIHLISLKEQSLTLFSKNEILEIFVSLGGITKTLADNLNSSEIKFLSVSSSCYDGLRPRIATENYINTGFRPLPKTPVNLVSRQLNPPICSCAGGSQDYCSWWTRGATCQGISCQFTNNGCGFGLLYQCVGLCALN